MPTKKYRIETDKGAYQVEVEEPYQGTSIPGFSTPLVSETDETGKAVTPKEGPVNSFLRRTSENPLLQRMAHPQSMGDFLSLLIPEAPRALAPAAMRGLKSFRDGGFKGVREWAFGKPQYTQEATGQLWNELPEAVKAEYLPGGARAGKASIPENPQVTRTGTARPVEQLPTNDLPLYRQQQILEQTGTRAGVANSSSRVGMPPARAPQPKPPNVKPPARKAQTLEDVLTDAVGEARGPSLEESRHTLPPEMRTAGEGVTKQSGTFSKSGSVGQPGGYTSGRPGVTQQRYDEITGPRTTEDDLYNALTEKLGMGQSNPSGETVGSGPHPEMAAERASGVETQATAGNPATGVSPPASEPPAAIQLGPSPVENASRLESPLGGGESEWHSGAEVGSAEAAAARKLHRGSGESTVPSVFQVPGIDELLASILRKGQ